MSCISRTRYEPASACTSLLHCESVIRCLLSTRLISWAFVSSSPVSEMPSKVLMSDCMANIWISLHREYIIFTARPESLYRSKTGIIEPGGQHYPDRDSIQTLAYSIVPVTVLWLFIGSGMIRYGRSVQDYFN